MSNTHNTNIIKLLLSNKKEQYTIRAIAKATNIDYKATYLTIQDLVKNNIIHTKKAGQATLCSINRKTFNNNIFQAEEERRKLLLKNKNIASMYSYFKDIKDPFFILLLFGSYAKESQRKKSDIDLLLITNEESTKKEIEKNVNLIPLNIHFLQFTSKEFLSMLKTTEFNVGKEAFYNNIILFGIEDYYRLIQNA